MRTKKASQLFNLVCAAALLFATSCKNQSEENNNSKNKSYVYDTIYKTDGYILLKIKDINNGTKEDKEKIALYRFDSINGPGSEILVQDAKSEIGAFRKKYNTATDSLTKYASFSYTNLFNYMAKFRSPFPDGDTETGIRIYPALKSGTNGKDSLTFIFGPTYKGKNQWRKSTTVAAFNTGSLCPDNCPDDDDNFNN